MTAPRILVVDDDPDARRVFVTLLRARYEVDEADGGALAVERLQSARYALVILDLHMPGVDGFAVLDAIGRSGDNCDVPVIVVSAVGTDEVRFRAVQRERVVFLPKPVPIRVLSNLVDATIAKAGR